MSYGQLWPGVCNADRGPAILATTDPPVPPPVTRSHDALHRTFFPPARAPLEVHQSTLRTEATASNPAIIRSIVSVHRVAIERNQVRCVHPRVRNPVAGGRALQVRAQLARVHRLVLQPEDVGCQASHVRRRHGRAVGQFLLPPPLLASPTDPLQVVDMYYIPHCGFPRQQPPGPRTGC